jgi:hypothetical protein
MRLGSVLLCAALATSWAPAQSIISAHSGAVHYVEGDVAIDGTGIEPKFGEFPGLKDGQVLTTEEGRAEVLLTPGVFLRMAENSSVRMLSNALTDTRLQVISGSVMVEAGELLANNAITFECQGVQIALPKKGLYEIDAAAARLRVYDGQALVSLGAAKTVARKSRQIALDSEALTEEKFDVKESDAFYRWNARRADYIAAANVVSAHVESSSSGYLRAGNTGSWNWNPYFGMFTFLPATGVYNSPFGSSFYSPGLVDLMYSPQPIYTGPVSLGRPPAMIQAPANPGASLGGGRSAAPSGGGFPGAGSGGGARPGGVHH